MFSLSTWRVRGGISEPPLQESLIVDQQALTKTVHDSGSVGPSGPWQLRTGPVWSVERTHCGCQRRPGMVISPGRQPVGTAESKGLKIYLWEAITGIKSGRERRGAFEMQRKDDCHPLQFAPSTYNIDFIYVSIIWLDGWVIIICRRATRELIVDGRQQHKGSKT